MINLMPPEYKVEIIYARRNVVVLRWLVVMFIALVVMLGIIFGGQMYMRQTSARYTQNVNKAREQLQSQNFEETQAKLASISNNVKLAIQVLSREILFSKLIRQLGSAMPENTVLKQLQIDKLQGPITLQAQALDITAATQLQVNLQDPANKIFEKADIETINCSPNAGEKQIYPCSVQIKALFAKDNPFLFISRTRGATP